jgi:hypothetical protein
MAGSFLVHLLNKRVRRTMKRLPIHNIYSSCHVAVTYIMDKGPQSPEHRNIAPAIAARACAKDET